VAYEMRLSCDNCGKLRQETNHWIALRETRDGLYLLWLDAVRTDDMDQVKHFCGRNCALQAISRYLDNESLDGKQVDDER
jgi:hypothetical protein